MTSADLRKLTAFLKRKFPAKANVATWGADQIDLLINWQGTATIQMAQQSSAIKDCQAQVANLQAQVAALQVQAGNHQLQVNSLQAQLAEMPTALVLLGTHLHGFVTSADADAFILANSNQKPTKFDTTDFTWHRTT